MADVSGVDNLTSSSNGSTSLAGIKSAVDNLNSAKLEGSGTAGDIATFPASGNSLQDSGKTLPTGSIVGTSDTQTMTNKTLTAPTITSPSTTGTDSGAQTLLNKIINAALNTISNITEAMLALTDVTTGNASSSAHGFLPKSPGDSTKFLNGANPPAYVTPPGVYTTGLGVWSSASADGSPHQVTTDGFLVGTFTHGSGGSSSDCVIYSDSSNPPTTIRQTAFANVTSFAPEVGFFVPIRKNDYYKIVLGTGWSVSQCFFLPIS